MCSSSIGVTCVQKYVNSMRLPWNSIAIKHMRKRLKPGLFPALRARPENKASMCDEHVQYNGTP